ncbi:MAG: ROK family protein [Thermoleophilia bacterium]
MPPSGLDPGGLEERIVRIVLGVDIGGTKIAVGRVTRNGRLLGEAICRPSDTGSESEFLEGLYAVLVEALGAARNDGHEVRAIGLGCAGTVARARGAIVVSPNLPLVDVPLARLVRERTGLPATLDNDANVATLAEARVGAAAGLQQVVMLTLGTGVGGGIVLDGRLYRGATGAAGELGHTIVVAGGERCRCGAFGCLEAYASGTALERTAARLVGAGGRREVLTGWQAVPEVAGEVAPVVDTSELSRLLGEGRLTGEEIGQLARSGDPGARAALHEVGTWLGVGAANLANIFEPQVIVVGGGLSTLGELLLAPARRVLAAAALAPNREAALLTASVGNDAGMVGAGLVCWEEYAEGIIGDSPSDPPSSGEDL